jgi:hypothetical protein
MSQFKRPPSIIFQHLTYENHYLKLKNADLAKTNNTLEANVSELNHFITSQYDLSFNVLENLRIVTFDGSGSVLSCIHTDTSGNFVACTEISGGYLPCVLPPMLETMAVSDRKVSKTHISDASRDFPYDYPYYRYPYYRYPYYGYGYPYPYLIDDDYLYRGMDMSCAKLPVPQQSGPVRPQSGPVHPPFHPSLINGSNGTHIHIHK